MDDREHVISVVLNNEDWKALLQLQPEPVRWLKECIQQRIAAEGRRASTASTASTAQVQAASSAA
jgi:hypothetical protein